MKNDPPHDPATQTLLEYCKRQSCFISVSIEPHRFPGSGLGIRARKPVKKGQELMHVPTKALLTTAAIPQSFLPRKNRGQLKVHALLAAYLAFSPDASKYSEWMASWPKLLDFRLGMPMNWPGGALYESHLFPSAISWTFEQQGLDPKLTQASRPTKATPPQTSEDPLKPLDAQIAKSYQDFKDICRLLPSLSPQLHDVESPGFHRFMHMWCCVNTRCFYYVPPGQTPPTDTNEAMALCPGMDLFNHISTGGCAVRYDDTGYYVTADRNYTVGEEILLCYGKHSNEALWIEYGFMLDENVEDLVRIDAVVLGALDGKQKKLLEENGYLGRYELRRSGVCWRTEMAAWLCVLDREKWIQLVEGKIDPADDPNLNGMQKRQLWEWIGKAKAIAEGQRDSLQTESTLKRVVTLFGDKPASLKVVMEYDSSEESMEVVRKKQATARHTMCFQRWKQLTKLCEDAMRGLQD